MFFSHMKPLLDFVYDLFFSPSQIFSNKTLFLFLFFIPLTLLILFFSGRKKPCERDEDKSDERKGHDDGWW
jgi:uncharacterized membrane protein